MSGSNAATPRSGWLAPFRFGVSAPFLGLLALLLAMVLLRCYVASSIDFEDDEAYYWLWSRHLSLSYFDHPPLIAYLIRIGTWLFGDTIFGIRSMAIAAMIAASLLLYYLTLILFGQRRLGLIAVLWYNMTPYAAFFSIIMYPDTPAILFWLLCCMALALVWRSGRGEWWYLAGLAGGLLMLSKYTGVFLLVGIGGWLLASDEMRPWLRRREPYLGALIAFALFSPVIVWNAEHDWASFAKQFGRALDSTVDGGLANVGTFLGIQAAFVSPLIFVFAVTGIAVAAWRGLRQQQANWLLLAVAAAPLVYFLIHALSAEVMPQWPSAAYATAIIAAVAAFTPQPGASPQKLLIRYGFAAAPWVGLALTFGLCVQMTIRPVAVAAERDPLSRFVGWAGLAADTRALALAHHAAYIATDHYGLVATMTFYSRDIPVFQTSEAIRYLYLPPVDQALLKNTTGLYVASPPFDDVAQLQSHYDSMSLIGTVWRNRNGDPIKPYRIYELNGYRGGVPY